MEISLMCGIVGVIGDGAVAPLLVSCLERLEYRGYDSCGMATLNSRGVEIRKGVGPVREVSERRGFARAHGGLGIAHTRWATHGGVSEENAHPHCSCDGKIAVVHNGIFTNYRALRSDLEARGHRFRSQTDTEVFAHLVEEAARAGLSVEEAFAASLRRVEGSFAIAMIAAHEPEKIFCAREKSPLILGLDAGTNFVGSDINAFLEHTRRAVLLEDGEYAIVGRAGYEVRAIAGGEAREKRALEIEWQLERAGKAGYAHYMEKEIDEQPQTVRRALEIPRPAIASLAASFAAARRRLLVGVGTTYYVALYGQYLMAALARETAQAVSSDEALHLALPDATTFVLAISQSGETFDTLEALRQARAAGAATAAIVNMPGSTMTREAEQVILQNSGPEICVISTKAAMAQLVLLSRLAAQVAFQNGRISAEAERELLAALALAPERIRELIARRRCALRRLALQHCRARSYFFLGRGLYTPIAFESALKMKEVTYLHAEGMQAGFLKHGTLSLIDEETPAVFLLPPAVQKEIYDLTMSSAEEVRARRGKVIGFGFGPRPEHFDEWIELPQAARWTAPLLHLVAAQLLAYETAVALGRNVDRPRSLAKSVTVA
ncbi:MAG TPA: glutamine--fructose-6-phosphate transaminase (isomerizing) [Candidatus Acidoferrales bacterium]|nr:glutamine--fructose-6-phosphate transaminase (isomerizing) [Candidatus Acidoferrales bacterium]